MDLEYLKETVSPALTEAITHYCHFYAPNNPFMNDPVDYIARYLLESQYRIHLQTEKNPKLSSLQFYRNQISNSQEFLKKGEPEWQVVEPIVTLPSITPVSEQKEIISETNVIKEQNNDSQNEENKVQSVQQPTDDLITKDDRKE